jgi:hypothetical protein
MNKKRTDRFVTGLTGEGRAVYGLDNTFAKPRTMRETRENIKRHKLIYSVIYELVPVMKGKRNNPLPLPKKKRRTNDNPRPSQTIYNVKNRTCASALSRRYCYPRCRAKEGR